MDVIVPMPPVLQAFACASRLEADGMALFEREQDEFRSDAGTRALSVIAVENDFVARVYEKLANSYDIFFGRTLNAGRALAYQQMDIQPHDRILEVGVGTGISAKAYPTNCTVTGIDLSSSMLEIARQRVAEHRLHHIRLLEMDAAALTFPANSFDIVYAPYLINVVSDPLKVVREMRRVCRPGGKIVFVNHFRSENFILSRLERAISPLTVHIGFKSDFDLSGFLAQAELKDATVHHISSARFWSVITYINPE
jgi:phosphatidylethanolamine/phosphatidyl-N-methylethanolamine N-methyltransferase